MSAVLNIPSMTDQEREAHILDCGRLMLKAMKEGDRAGAQRWLKLQNEAVLSRSPDQVARMEACYFASEGAKAREAAAQRVQFDEFTRIANAGGM